MNARITFCPSNSSKASCWSVFVLFILKYFKIPSSSASAVHRRIRDHWLTNPLSVRCHWHQHVCLFPRLSVSLSLICFFNHFSSEKEKRYPQFSLFRFVKMGDTSATSSSTSSTKLNSSASTVKKRTLSDAGLDQTLDGDNSNHGKRVVVFEAFKLFDVQSAVSLQDGTHLSRSMDDYLGRIGRQTPSDSKSEAFGMCAELPQG